MIGIVLWYNPDKQVGLVWCEDQGPLAYIGPEIEMPAQAQPLGCGDQISFLHELREKVRYVTRIEQVSHGRSQADPRVVLSAYHEAAKDTVRAKPKEKPLRVVA